MEQATRGSTRAEPSRAAIDQALDQVYDPELDESILKLGFVEAVEIAGATVTVTYRLPTYWCSPNFAYMMAADLRREVGQVPGVAEVRAVIRDHCAEHELNAGVNAGHSFQETFPGDAVDDLDELRRKFWEKSFLARQEVLIRRLRSAGLGDEQIVALQSGDVELAGDAMLVLSAPTVRVRPGADDMRKYMHRRKRLLGSAGPLFCRIDGGSLAAGELDAYLRRSRMVRLSIAFNTSLCEGLLRTRYEPERAHDATSLGDALLLTPTTP